MRIPSSAAAAAAAAAALLLAWAAAPASAFLPPSSGGGGGGRRRSDLRLRASSAPSSPLADQLSSLSYDGSFLGLGRAAARIPQIAAAGGAPLSAPAIAAEAAPPTSSFSDPGGVLSGAVDAVGAAASRALLSLASTYDAKLALIGGCESAVDSALSGSLLTGDAWTSVRDNLGPSVDALASTVLVGATVLEARGERHRHPEDRSIDRLIDRSSHCAITTRGNSRPTIAMGIGRLGVRVGGGTDRTTAGGRRRGNTTPIGMYTPAAAVVSRYHHWRLRFVSSMMMPQDYELPARPVQSRRTEGRRQQSPHAKAPR